MKSKRIIYILAAILLLAAFLVGIFFLFTIRYTVTTDSMESTFSEDDCVLGVRGRVPQQGSFIIFSEPKQINQESNSEDNAENNAGYNAEDNPRILMKRVIGMPGDVISITYGKVYVNEVELSEPYVTQEWIGWNNSSETMVYTVPENSYFVMNDNRMATGDSRSFGCVPGQNVIAQGVAVLSPKKHARKL